MYIIFIIALAIVANSIIGNFLKRKKAESILKKKIDIKINSYISYGNITYGIFLSVLIIYLLYDKSTQSIDLYSLLIATLVIIVVAYKSIAQYFFKPLFSDEGILFYNGILLHWNNINELNSLGTRKNGDGILFVGGNVNSKVVVREKVVIHKEDLLKVESILLSKTKIN